MDSHIPTDVAVQRSIYRRQCTMALEHLTGIISGIMADGRLDAREVQFLSTWLSSHPEAVAEWPGTLISRKVRDVLADGVITAAELDHLKEVLHHLGGSDFSTTGEAACQPITLPINDVVTVKLRDASLCLTGEFLYGTRAACERVSLAIGAMPVDNVSRRLDYLVIGTRVSPAWATMSYGRKIQRACELQSQGHPIEIISEKRWLEALQT